MDKLARARVLGTGMFAMTAGLTALMAFLLVAEVFLVPQRPLLAAPRTPKALHASGWVTVGGLDADAARVRSVAHAMPPPVDPVQLEQVVLYAQAAFGSTSSRLAVDVYEISTGKGATGPARLVTSGTVGIDGPHPGLMHLFFDPPVRARPGHWYTFVLWTSEPGSGVILGLVTGGLDTPSLWTLDGRAAAKPAPGRGPWAQLAGFKLLLVMQY